MTSETASAQAGGAWSKFVDWLIGLFPGWVTPNHLSFLRLALAGGMLALEFADGSLGLIILMGLAAGFSDLFDGALARRRGMVTELGAFLDPLGDKVFALVLVIIVWQRELAPHWLILSLILTELHTVLIPVLVMVDRVKKGIDLWPPTKVKPNRLGKMKTFALAMGLGWLIIGHWMGQVWMEIFFTWCIYAGFALGLAAEVKYFNDYKRGDYV